MWCGWNGLLYFIFIHGIVDNNVSAFNVALGGLQWTSVLLSLKKIQGSHSFLLAGFIYCLTKARN